LHFNPKRGGTKAQQTVIWAMKLANFPTKPLYKGFIQKLFLIKVLRQGARGFIRNISWKRHRLARRRIIA
jgi:hypothetical protein